MLDKIKTVGGASQDRQPDFAKIVSTLPATNCSFGCWRLVPWSLRGLKGQGELISIREAFYQSKYAVDGWADTYHLLICVAHKYLGRQAYLHCAKGEVGVIQWSSGERLQQLSRPRSHHSQDHILCCDISERDRAGEMTGDPRCIVGGLGSWTHS